MIKEIKAKQIRDSRGNPTIEVRLKTDKGVFISKVPSGASTGKLEAVELRDDNKGVLKAVKNIEEAIGPKLIGMDAKEQKDIDNLMIHLDASSNKANLGGNAIVGISMAVCRAGAAEKRIPLYQHISELLGIPVRNELAKPIFNIINGGAHAKGSLDIQEFIAIPQEESFSSNLKEGIKIYKHLGKNLRSEFGRMEMGDEGGYVPPISKTEDALKFILESGEDMKLGLDCAASQFFKDGKYNIEGKQLTSLELADYYKNLASKYPIIYMEDPFSEEDLPGWENFRVACPELVERVGDDLTVTNKTRVGEFRNVITGVIIKLNQVGTVSETLETISLAKSLGIKITVSHRSGETDDDFIADLAVGVSADYLKSGAPGPKERMVKYNRMAQIEKQINN